MALEGWVQGATGDGDSNRYTQGRWWNNRRFLVKVFTVLCLFGAFSFLATNLSATFSPSRWIGLHDAELNDLASICNKTTSTDEVPLWDSSLVLHGPPTMKFRDNLHQGKKYITSFISAGWTNDVMAFINLIYLGVITERIPILSSFLPTHIGEDLAHLPFSEAFDLGRLRRELKLPVLDWSEVKLNSSTELDELGCWNTWQVSIPNAPGPRGSKSPGLIGLDLSYTRVPPWVKLAGAGSTDPYLGFWPLASLSFEKTLKQNLIEPSESERFHLKLPPDNQLMCYDYLYYVGGAQGFEFEHDFSPAWRFVGRYLYFSPQLNDIADQYVRRTLGVADGEKTPAWIAIHIRHGDFKDMEICDKTIPPQECFAPLSAIARRVEEVQQELLQRKGIRVEHVLMTSDERNATWWEEVKARGWYQVDHSQTVAQHGPWHPVLIDAAIQAGGMGFVGTAYSTMSVLARRRVESWHDGAVRTVMWGRPGADDH